MENQQPYLMIALEDLLEWQCERETRTLHGLQAVEDDRVNAKDCGGHVRAVLAAKKALARAKHP